MQGITHVLNPVFLITILQETKLNALLFTDQSTSLRIGFLSHFIYP